MTDDLTDRLRAEAQEARHDPIRPELLEAAADEIDRLRAELDECEAENDHLLAVAENEHLMRIHQR